MKKKKITYGVRGMMEYQALVRVGKATMRVPFTDGSATAAGSTPATFATENYITQQLIERSADFRSGKIERIRVIELDEDETAVGGPSRAGDTLPQAPSDAGTTAGTVPGEEQPKPVAEADATGMKEVAVSDLETARDYLCDTFGLQRSKLRSEKSITDAAAARGVTFKYE